MTLKSFIKNYHDKDSIMVFFMVRQYANFNNRIGMQYLIILSLLHQEKQA